MRIPDQADHRIRRKPITHSDSSRSLICAAVAVGTNPHGAHIAARRTTAFYTGELAEPALGTCQSRSNFPGPGSNRLTLSAPSKKIGPLTRLRDVPKSVSRTALHSIRFVVARQESAPMDNPGLSEPLLAGTRTDACGTRPALTALRAPSPTDGGSRGGASWAPRHASPMTPRGTEAVPGAPHPSLANCPKYPYVFGQERATPCPPRKLFEPASGSCRGASHSRARAS